MTNSSPAEPTGVGADTAKERREIPGNFPYTPSHGVLGKVLQKIIKSERPSRFDADFMSTVLSTSGGSARAIPPILKRAGLLTADGAPTERYAQFQSDSKRAVAALDALRTGWPELFRKNRYANRLGKAELDDLFVEITGLTKTDQVFRAIIGTFNVFCEYAKDANEESHGKGESNEGSEEEGFEGEKSKIRLGISNQINLVLPETADINVYHSIFRAIRESLLR